MNSEYIKFLQAYCGDNVASEQEFNKAIKLFPNIEIDWNKVITKISDYYDSYTSCYEIINGIIQSIIDYDDIYVFDCNIDNKSIIFGTCGFITKNKITEVIHKVKSFGFTVEYVEDLLETAKNNECTEIKQNLHSDIINQINNLSLEQLEKLKTIVDNGLD